MKRIALVLCLVLCLSMLSSVAMAEGQITLRYMSLSDAERWDAEQKMIQMFEEENPDIHIEATAVAGVPDFITVLSTKFAADEAPDVFSFQGGSRTFEYASAGKLYDLTGQPFMDKFYDSDLELLRYKDGIYAMPINVEMNGLFVNEEALAQYEGVTVPTCFPELIEQLQKLRDAGCEYPLICAGKDIGNVSQVDFQYLATVLWFNNPDYYLELLTGKRAFNNDPDIYDLFDKYGQLREFMNPDSLGVDNEEAKKRFIRGDGVFWIAHCVNIPSIRALAGDEFNFHVYPSVLQDKPEDRVLNAGLCYAMHIVKDTEHLDAALKFMEFYSRPEVIDVYVTMGKQSAALKGYDTLPDPAFAPLYEFANANPTRRIGHADLVWIAGIKDVMKEVTQKWFLGEDLQACLDEWEAQHQQLLSENPAFVEEYIAKYYPEG